MRQIRFPAEPPEHRRARALRERVDDLRTARQRIIAAADAERRRSSTTSACAAQDVHSCAGSLATAQARVGPAITLR